MPPRPFENPNFHNYYDDNIPLGARSTDGLNPVYGNSADRYGYNQKQLTPKSSKKKWFIVCIIIAALIIIGAVVGVVVSKNKNKNNLTSGPGSSSNSPNSPNTSNTPENPNDPSNFTKNPAFHRSFYGMAYTPANSQLPNCGNSLPAVIADIQIISQLTSRLRLYGSDCNQSALVLEAIKQTKVNMTVFIANYPIATDNGTAYERQRDVMKEALQTYPKENIAGIVVGNEFMLNYVTNHNITDAAINGQVANEGAEILIGFINDTRQMLQGMGLSSIPVGNSDAGSYFNNEVLAAVDFGMANVHPWFADVTVQDSAVWTYNFFQQNDVDLANNLTNKPTMYIAETGWPTNSSTVKDQTNGASTASVANLQIFLDTFVCQANSNGTGYFFFEFADEEWKDIQFGGVEGYWGLFNQNLTLKDGITIPNCQSP